MKIVTPWITMGSLLAARAMLSRSSAAPAPPFRTAVEAHLSAVASRSMDALLPTLTRGNDLTMIAPNGFKWDTKQQYVDFHRQWFAMKDDGKLTYEIVRLIESAALGHALIKYQYSSKDPDGKPQVINSWLALTFALEDGSWRLVFDQNTALDPKVVK
jgi:ketosteroid isomerase-like protein